MNDQDAYDIARKKLLGEDFLDLEPPDTFQIEPDPSQQTPGDKIASNDQSTKVIKPGRISDKRDDKNTTAAAVLGIQSSKSQPKRLPNRKSVRVSGREFEFY